MSDKSKIRLTFLGTGTSIGVPIIGCDCEVCKSNDIKDNRLRSSVLFELDSKNLVVDCGPDFRYQMLRANIRNISAILFTHEHRDHVAGLDDIRAFNFIMKRKVPIYATKKVYEALEAEFPYIFTENKYKGSPELDMNLITNDPFIVEGIKVTPIEVLHHKLPVFGYRINDVVYITDASLIPDSEFQKLQGVKVLVINALRKRTHFSHFSLDEALEIINKVKPEKAYLTHISHMLGLHTDVSEELPENVYLAYDNLVIEI